MDYKNFRFEAVVDFIEIQIHTVDRTRGDIVKLKTGVSYATPVDKTSGNSASIFKICLYNVKSFADLHDRVRCIELSVPVSSPTIITMIEVAFDAYNKLQLSPAAAAASLAEMAAHMAYHVANPVSVNQRTFHDYKGSGRAMPISIEALMRELADGRNVGFGNLKDDKYQHGYFKTTDCKVPIEDQRQHRARFEIRLAGQCLPFANVEGWKDFKFESLAKYLSFRRQPDSPSKFREMMIDAYASKASHRRNTRRRSGGGTTAHIMPADADLNRIVRKRLQGLSLRWQTAEKGRENGTVKVTVS